MKMRTMVLREGIMALCVAALSISPAAAQSEQGKPPGARLTLTLSQALGLALDQNRDVMIAEQERYKAEALVTEARSGAFPQLAISGNYTRNIKKPVLFLAPNSILNPTDATQTFELGSDNSYVAGASLTQTLFNWKVGIALDIAHTYHEYAEETYRATVDDVSLAVKKAFYGVLLARELLVANRQGLEIVRANYDNVQAQYKYGTAAEFDLLRAEVQFANTEPLVISAENNLVLARNNLKNILALPLDSDVDAVGEFMYEEVPPEVLARARRDALTNNPVLTGLAFQESMLEKNIDIERSSYFPTLDLVGSYQFQTQDNTFRLNNYNWARVMTVGVTLSYPIFNGFKTAARAEQASIDRTKIKYTRLKAEEGMKIQIQSCELKMAEANKRVSGQKRTIEQAEKAVKIAQTRYRSGVGTQLELLDSQVAMTRVRTNYAQALYDFVIAQAEWSNAVGLAR